MDMRWLRAWDTWLRRTAGRAERGLCWTPHKLFLWIWEDTLRPMHMRLSSEGAAGEGIRGLSVHWMKRQTDQQGSSEG